MSYIGIIGASRLDKFDTSLNLLKQNKKAIALLRDDINMCRIKRETGWEIGRDGKWRYEIDDSFHTTVWIEDYIKRHFGEPINIRYCMNDTSLLVAYPEFERLKLYALYSQRHRWIGYFDPVRYGMMVCMGTVNSPFDQQIEGILLHEVQHLIQEVESFARGGNTSEGLLKYHLMAGEVEARNICHRHFLTKEERMIKLRSETQDVPDDQQIVRFF